VECRRIEFGRVPFESLDSMQAAEYVAWRAVSACDRLAAVMVDIMPRISGVEFETAWHRRVDIQIGDKLMVPFISRDDLLATKIAAGRAQDLADVAALRESAKYENDPQN
jgi:hypothetical protein